MKSPRDTRLTPEVVIKVIELNRLGFSLREITKKTPWHQTTINNIVQGEYFSAVAKRTNEEISNQTHDWKVSREFMGLDQKLVSGETFHPTAKERRESLKV